jgi:DNA topoisomerase-1
MMKYGNEYLPETPRIFPTKKTSQDAHEAIRPTYVDLEPEKIQQYLTIEELKLYSLIWKRFVSSQMTPAIYDTVGCSVGSDQGIVLRSTGSTIKFPGYLAVYQEKLDIEDLEKEKEDEKLLPNLEVGEKLKLGKVDSEQAFTKPPHRFTEASLVKELEKSGIGRPSTYAAIMGKIQSRDYTIKEKGSLRPTELGKVIAQMLEENFPIIMDIGFTAKMEDELERIEDHERDWKGLIKEFWKEFIPTIELAEKQAHVPKIETDLKCPKCGSSLQKIWSRRKYFYGCSTYPDCDYTMPIEQIQFKKEDYDPSFDWDQKCPKCGSEMTLRFGKFGPFLGCSKFPDCSGIVSIPKKG